jgi:hypothetical protein
MCGLAVISVCSRQHQIPLLEEVASGVCVCVCARCQRNGQVPPGSNLVPMGRLLACTLVTSTSLRHAKCLTAGVHAPTKSVSAISVVLIFHVIFMATQYTGPTGQSYQDDGRCVGMMPATPSINTPHLCAEHVRTRLTCDPTFCSVFGEDACLLFCPVFVIGVSCVV